MRAALLVLALLATPAAAQVSYPPVDASKVATKSEVQAAAALAATACQPAMTAPMSEASSATAGSAATCNRQDSRAKRITRATSCTLATGGTCTVTYEALPAEDPNIIPVAQSAQPIFCTKTAAATSTSASIRCWLYQSAVLTLAVVQSGITIGPAAAPAGTVVDVTALPKN